MSETLEPTPHFPESQNSQAANDLRAAASAGAAKANEKARAIKETAVEKASLLKDVAATKATEIKQVAGEKASQAKVVAEEQFKQTKDKAQELHESTENYIKANPTKSALIALGAGFLVGLMVRR